MPALVTINPIPESVMIPRLLLAPFLLSLVVAPLGAADEAAGQRWAGYTVRAQEGLERILDTPVGQVRVENGVGEASIAGPRLATLIAQATAAGLGADGQWSYRPSVMVGHYLSSPQALVLAEGVARLVPAPKGDDAALRQAIAKQAQEAVAQLSASRFEEPARRSITEVLQLLEQPVSGPVLDEVGPAFARQTALGGWLTAQLPLPAVPALAKTVAEAARYRPSLTYAGKDKAGKPLRVVLASNAWGEVLKFAAYADRTVVATRMPDPMWHWPLQKSKAWDEATVIVELPAGADPLVDPSVLGKARAAGFHYGEKQLVSWSAKGFQADEKAWRSLVPAGGKGLDEDLIAGAMPPHIVIATPDGAVFALITRHGVLRPAVDGGKAEGERFLADAAKLLPDAPHLDLVGQYLFKYVYDSPDPAHPYLMGSPRIKGDIHQTALQTLSTTSLGVCRGDCDDLSELFQEVLIRQGRLAHVISLPQHAAVAWAEERPKDAKKPESGKQWHAFVMQTGPSQEFRDERLPEALRKAYTSFDAGETFDPNGLGLLLRFSGENTRSAWRLSWRIFQDRIYAETMIAVQRDWHFQTYLQGIDTMLKLIADGDDDTANYRELSGLYNFTGQYAKAAEYHGKAIERTTEDDSRLLLSVEYVGHLLDAGQRDEARRIAERIIDTDLPAMKARLGQAAPSVALELAGVLAGRNEAALATRALDGEGGAMLAKAMDGIAQWSRTRYSSRDWQLNSRLASARRMGERGVYLTIQIAEKGGVAVLAERPGTRELWNATETWLRDVAFNEQEDASSLMQAYALLARAYQATLGKEDLLRRLDSVSTPSATRADHRQRLGGLAQVASDLPWIKASLPFWWAQFAEYLGKDAAKPSQAELDRLVAGLRAALAAQRTLELADSQLEMMGHEARVAIAIVTGDLPALRERLQHVKRLNDKRLRDDTAQLLGDSARLIPLDRFKQVMQAWVDEVDYKDKYLWIAWRAALVGAREHALHAAAVAAARFKDDPAFVAEHRFMMEKLAATP
jgi:tetratricopeptide (TPR) repeat protein